MEFWGCRGVRGVLGARISVGSLGPEGVYVA